MDELANFTPTPVLATQLDVSVAPAAQYIVFATTRIDDECAGAVPVARGLQITVDADTATFSHRPDNCAYELTYGHVELRSSAPATISTSFSSPQSEEVTHEETTLFVLGVD